METVVYDVLEEVTGQSYDALLDFCHRHGTHCSLVVREGDVERGGIVAFLQLAKPYLRSVADESEWPGTQLSGHTATVYRYQLSVDFLALLKTRSRGLFDWVSTWNSNRELPEDMAIYRSDGSVLLGSIAHECEAWLELTPDEYRQASDLPLKLSKRS